MSDFVPTHRTRAGVEVDAIIDPKDGYTHARLPGTDLGAFCNPRVFAALFEPIAPPPPDTVTVNRAGLRCMLRCFYDLKRTDRPVGFAELARAAGMENESHE